MPQPLKKTVKLVKRCDVGGARRLTVRSAEPAPTVMAGGIGSVNTSQYHVTDGPSETAGAKPPYRVPSMAEIAKVPHCGLTAVSTFSGCGGSSLGYRMAGFKVLWASEFIEAARDSYAANMATGTILDGRDIRTVKPEEILRAIKMRPGQLDLLDGSPPCASFSTAGKRQEGWGKVKKYSDTEQRTDDLFFEFVRILRGLRPRTFVAENVSGLVKGTAKGYFIEIMKALKESGYRVACRVLDAQWLGVPQQRQRTIFVGVREDLKDASGAPIQPVHPLPLPYRYSVREAIPWLGRSDGTGNVRHTLAGRPPTRSTAEAAPTVSTVPQDSLIGARVWHDHPDGTKERIDLDAPGPTVRAGSKNRNRTDQFLVEEANGLNSVGQGGHRMLDCSDRPFPTVQAGRPVRVADGRGDGATVCEDTFGERRVYDERAAPSIRAKKAGHLTVIEPEASMDGLATGREWDAMNAPAGTVEQSGKYFQLVKAAPGAPSPTVTAEGGNAGLASVCHPTERRKFSIAELKRICAFPDDFVLTGTYAQRWERLGRAVPPLMMRAVAEVVRDQVLRKVKK